MPPDWEPNDEHVAYAEAERVDLERAKTAFVARHRARATQLVDWDAEFGGWLANAPRMRRTQRRRDGLQAITEDTTSGNEQSPWAGAQVAIDENITVTFDKERAKGDDDTMASLFCRSDGSSYFAFVKDNGDVPGNWECGNDNLPPALAERVQRSLHARARERRQR